MFPVKKAGQGYVLELWLVADNMLINANLASLSFQQKNVKVPLSKNTGVYILQMCCWYSIFEFVCSWSNSRKEIIEKKFRH